MKERKGKESDGKKRKEIRKERRDQGQINGNRREEKEMREAR